MLQPPALCPCCGTARGLRAAREGRGAGVRFFSVEDYNRAVPGIMLVTATARNCYSPVELKRDEFVMLWIIRVYEINV